MNPSSSAPRTPSRKQLIIDAGRAHLRTWLLAAEEHGTIYYNVQSVSRSGMDRKIALSTIFPAKLIGDTSKPELVRCWPAIPNVSVGSAHNAIHEFAFSEYNAALDIIARDWGFSFDARAFNVSGAGMDMVFQLVYTLAGKALPREDALPYTNRVRRESF